MLNLYYNYLNVIGLVNTSNFQILDNVLNMDNEQLDKQLLLNIVEVLFKMSALFKSADNISLI